MIEVPKTIGNAKVLAFLVLSNNHVKTGATKHYIGGQVLEDTYGLAICQYNNDDGYYLFYCNSDWVEATDTYHETVEDAIGQAEFEYQGTQADWQFITETSG